VIPRADDPGFAAAAAHLRTAQLGQGIHDHSDRHHHNPRALAALF
jgi:hypothetical protein